MSDEIKISEKARQLLAEEYERGDYSSYAMLAIGGQGDFTLCSLRAIQRALGEGAERQVGELREQLENANDRAFCASEAHVITMAKLDTAMTLLRDANTDYAYYSADFQKRVTDFLNITSTEGKDHE